MRKITKTIGVLAMFCFFMDVGAQDPQQEALDSLLTREMNEVVVTALGVKREKKALGYSTQEVKTSELTTAPAMNFTQGLSGKVSGLQVKGVGNFAGSVDVVLRGYRSILGNNSPLYVIDGVPILNANNNSSSQSLRGRFGYDFGNTVSDINPNDIEEINVLKGAAASALYGSRAQNGAIIITTKKGKRGKEGIGIEYSTTIGVSSIDKETFVKYQKQYGQGYGGDTTDTDAFDLYTPPGSSTPELLAYTGDDASFGKAFDPNKMVWQYGAFIPGSPYFEQKTPWVAAKNDPSKFFETGENYVNDIAITKTSEAGSFRFSYQNQKSTDIMPNSGLSKNTFSIGGSYDIVDKLNATFNVSYVDQNVRGRNVTGYSGNIISGFRQWWPVNIDIKEQRDFYFMSKKNYTWNINGPNDINPAFWNNPYFERYENYVTDSRERTVGNFSLSYDIHPNINLLGRMGTDGYVMIMDERKAVGSYPDDFAIGPASVEQPSGYAIEDVKERESNYDFIATYKKNFDNDISLNGLVGGNINVRNYNKTGLSTSGGLLVPGIYTIANSIATPVIPSQIETKKKIVGVFGQAQVGYQGIYYVEGTLRRDQSSALPKNNNEYWYYSVSGSLAFSGWDFLADFESLSFGKLRASYAEVGSDTGADQLLNQYSSQSAFQGMPVSAYNTSAKNAKLKPERSKQTEFGANAMFFNNRVGFDVAWYRTDSYDQILPLSQSSSTGFLNYVQNVGTLRTEGWEIALNFIPIKTTDFRWNMDLNWSNPYTKVVSLAEGVENITIGSFQGGVTINASRNEGYGTIKGSGYVYKDGQKIVTNNGNSYIRTDNDNIIGNIQAKWFGGVTNTFTYKNLSLSFQIDVKQGGNIFSLDQYYGLDTGIYPETAGLNHLGNPIRSAVNLDGNGNPEPNSGGVILPGVYENGDQNNKIINLTRGHLGYGKLPAEAQIFDASYVKLRQISLAYSFPKSLLDRTFIQNLTLTFIGNNLWIIDKKLPYADPEAGLSSGNAQGWQSGVMPTSRVFSFNLKANF